MALTAAEIRDCYRIVLGREPDEGGLATHLEYVRKHGISDPHVLAKMFIAGEEFQAKLPRKTPGGVFDELAEASYRGIRFLLPRLDFSFRSVEMPGGYEPYVSNHLFARLRPGEVFLDVGANLGLFALPAARAVGPAGHVLAIEASQDNARLLLANANRNNIANLSIFPLGAGDVNGSVSSPRQKNSSDKVLLPPSAQPRYKEEHDLIPIVRLDDLLSGFGRRIDVVKMDVEGYEYRVVVGAQSILRAHRPDVYLEYSDTFQRHGSQVPGATLLRLLSELGYRFTVLHREEKPEPISDTSADRQIAVVDERLARVVAAGGTHLDLYVSQSA